MNTGFAREKQSIEQAAVAVFPSWYEHRKEAIFPIPLVRNIFKFEELSPYETTFINLFRDRYPELPLRPLLVVFAPVRDSKKEKEFVPEDFYPCGTLAALEIYIKEEEVHVIGLERVKISWINQESISAGARVKIVDEGAPLNFQDPAIIAKIDYLATFITENKKFIETDDRGTTVIELWQQQAEEIKAGRFGVLLDVFAAAVGIDSPWDALLRPYRYATLETASLTERLDKTIELADKFDEYVKETQKLGRKNRQRDRVAFLREHKKAIDDELGEKENSQAKEWEIQLERLKNIKPPLSPRVFKEVERRLRDIRDYRSDDPAFKKIEGWLNTVLIDLPWGIRTKDNLDLNWVRQILEEDHYGLDPIKERLIGYVAVMARQEELIKLIAAIDNAEINDKEACLKKLNILIESGEIADAKGCLKKLVESGDIQKIIEKEEYKKRVVLLFEGPPGVAKTSLGKSIARAFGRKFFSVSLGGIKDEHFITGFDETYVGSMPGRIIQGFIAAGSENPVLMYDEIDKMEEDRGNPQAAFLAMLDSTLTEGFADQYIRVPFPISRALIIATANSTEKLISALKDRCELVVFPGYILEEKLQIAKRHLIPAALRYHVIPRDMVEFPNETIETIINLWTREAGVRNLERAISAICRKAVTNHQSEKIIVSMDALPDYLEPSTIYDETAGPNTNEPGIAVALAATETGGSISFVEAEIFSGTREFEKQIILTGSIKEVMQESSMVALTRLWKLAENNNSFGITAEKLQKSFFRVHIAPLGTTKDGPSATITFFSALVSAISGRSINLKIAMTGEMTQNGRVTAVGGLLQKFFAARRAHIEKVLFPAVQLGEVGYIIKKYPILKEGLEFIPVRTDKEVLEKLF